MYYVDQSMKPNELRMFLTKPDKKRTTIDELVHITTPNLEVNSGKIHQLSFSVPFKTEINFKIVDNPHINKIKSKYFIKVIYNNLEEWFLINKISKNSSEDESMDVECFGLGYQLWYRRVIDYVGTSLNLLKVATDCLHDTGWEVGYINPEFNLNFRQFDVSSKRKLDFIYEIAETFEAIPHFDSVNKKVHFYKEDEINKYNGFWMTCDQYLTSIDEEIDIDQVVTRLHVRGADNLKINTVNPTGQSYVDDFSYLIYPYEEDEEGNVINSSPHMSDELCRNLIRYNKYVSERKNEFANHLKDKKDQQELLTVQQNELSELKIQLQVILDAIQVAEENGTPKNDLITQRTSKNSEIEIVEQKISLLNDMIKSIDYKIDKLKQDLKITNFLNETEYEELISNCIHEDEWSDENKIDESDLYEASLKRISEINSPPVNIKVNIINFFSMISEHKNWNRLSLGDIVRIKHPNLGIDIKATVSQISFNFDDESIDITISNSKKREATTYEEMIKRSFYTIGKVNTDYNNRKIDWKKNSYNFNLRNDRISEKPTNPSPTSIPLSYSSNDNGSVNMTVKWNYPDFNKTNKNEDNIDGFHLFLYSSKDSQPYQFGFKAGSETVIPIEGSKRAYTFQSIPGNLHYTLGIRAYRAVDDDIDSEGVLYSDIVKLNDSKTFQPESKVNIKAALNGVTYTTNSVAPPSPDIGDVWINAVDTKTNIWDGEKWNVNDEVKQVYDYTAKNLSEAKQQFEEDIQRATASIRNAETELIFDERGLTGQSKTFPNHLVTFNSGGVGVSTDGGLTYRTAMTANGFVADLISGGKLRGIEIEGVTISGSTFLSKASETNFAMIEGANIQSRGQYTRTWDGVTKSYDAKIDIQNGYVAARNLTENQNLYYMHNGISTFATGNQAESSGTIEFFSNAYHAIRKGVTVSSAGGAVALRSNLERVILDSLDDTMLVSRGNNIKIQPRRDTVVGNNTFVYHTIANSDPSQTDGVLYYGSENNPQYSVGIRMSKASGVNTIWITDGTASKNTGHLSAKTLSAQENFNTSSITYKTNIEDLEESGLYAVNKLSVKRYLLQSDVDSGNYSNWQVGVLSELSPEIATQNLLAVNLYKLLSYCVKAIQELSAEKTNDQQEIADLKLLIGVVFEQLNELKDNKEE